MQNKTNTGEQRGGRTDWQSAVKRKKNRRRIKRIVGYDSTHHTHTHTDTHEREREREREDAG